MEVFTKLFIIMARLLVIPFLAVIVCLMFGIDFYGTEMGEQIAIGSIFISVILNLIFWINDY